MMLHCAEILRLRFGAQTDFVAAKSGQASSLRRANRSSLLAEGVRTVCGRFTGIRKLFSRLSAKVVGEWPTIRELVRIWSTLRRQGGAILNSFFQKLRL